MIAYRGNGPSMVRSMTEAKRGSCSKERDTQAPPDMLIDPAQAISSDWDLSPPASITWDCLSGILGWDRLPSGFVPNPET